MGLVLALVIFAFGYYTCHTFYYYRSVHAGIVAIKTAQAVSLTIAVLALQEFIEAQTLNEKAKIDSGETEHNINALKCINEREIAYFKDRAIKKIINAHPSFFKPLLDFNDWDSAMEFLEANRATAFDFMNKDLKKGQLK
jgi:hypothetical protein